MGIRLINSIIFSELLCNPYKQVTFWLFVILNYIYIYEYKHIYIRLAILSYNLLISYKITDLLNACQKFFPWFMIIVSFKLSYTNFKIIQIQKYQKFKNIIILYL